MHYYDVHQFLYYKCGIHGLLGQGSFLKRPNVWLYRQDHRLNLRKSSTLLSDPCEKICIHGYYIQALYLNCEIRNDHD